MHVYWIYVIFIYLILKNKSLFLIFMEKKFFDIDTFISNKTNMINFMYHKYKPQINDITNIKVDNQ